MSRFLALIMVLLMLALKSAAQVGVDSTLLRPSSVENLLEMLAERDNLSEDALSDISHNLITLLDDPVNLNDTMPDNLSRLPISEFQISSIKDYIHKHGQLVSPYELQLVPGFDEEINAQLLPFFRTTPIEKSRAKRVFRSSVLTRYKRVLEKQKGYQSTTSNGYLGSPDAFLLKAKVTATPKIQLGFTAEKDAGEEFFKGSNPNGFDFYSGYLSIVRLGVIKQVVVGDFSANFGQGLTLASGYSLGKASLMTSPAKRQRTVSPYSSTDENQFFRGVAAITTINKVTITTFASKKYMDASVEADTSGFGQSIETIQATGSHATNTEIANKHNVLETAGGINAAYNIKDLRVGVSCFGLKADKSYIPSTKPYQLLDSDPTDILRFGMDFLYYQKRATYFGEAAIDRNSAKAIVAGTSINIATAFNAMLIGRNYENGFPDRFTGGFGEGGKTSGEKGVCLALQFSPYKKWRVRTYADFFEFTWLRYRISAPSNGTELSFVTDYTPNKSTALQIGFTQNKRPYDVIINNQTTLQQTTRRTAKVQLTFAPAESVTTKTRIETTWYSTQSTQPESGFMILQDVTWRNSSNNLTISGRVAFYKTSSWNTRIYTYETDLLHSFSVPAYYLSGARYYVVAGYTISDSIKLWIKWSRTQLFNKNEVGSGLVSVNGNVKNEFKAQILLRF